MEHGILPHEFAELTQREKAIMIAQLQIEEKKREKEKKAIKK